MLLVAAVSLLPRAAHAQVEVVGSTESGTASVLFQFNQSTTAPVVLTGPLFTVVVPTVPRANLRLNTSQFIPNFGQVEAAVDFANGVDSLVPRRGGVALSEMRVGSWTAGASFGDFPFDVYTVDVGAAAVYQPLTGLRGGRISFSRGPAKYALFGGQSTTINGFFGESVLVSDQLAFGARAALRPSGQVQVGFGLLHTTETSLMSLPTGRISSATVTATYDPTPPVRLFGEVSTARVSGHESGTTSIGNDASYIVGARVRSDRMRAELSLLRLGPGYIPLAYTNLGNRAGVFGTVDYRVNARLSLNAVFNRWNNDVRRPLDRPVFHADNVQLGTRFRVGSRLFGALRAGQASGTTFREEQGSSENQGPDVQR